ncbi:MAG TPA: diguanylate cyclase [Alphaproteobacteria bacterium]|nr:diguanylate cyclase [Alphaproteobacteria bacterium]
MNYPGPAFAIGADGGAAALNPAGGDLLAELAALRDPALADWTRRARQGARAQAAIDFDTLRLPGAEGERELEVTLVPAGAAGGLFVLCRDVTFERNLRAALIDSRQRYKDLVEISSDFVWETDAAGTLIFVSPSGALGYGADALVGQRADGLIAEGVDQEHPSPFAARTPQDRVVLWLKRRDGEAACVEVTALPLVDEGGDWRGARGICRDVTVERARDAELARRRHRAQLNAFILRSIWDEVDPDKVLPSAAAAVARAVSAAGCQIYWFRGMPRLMPAAAAGAAIDGKLVDGVLAGIAAATKPVAHKVEGWQILAMPTRYRRAVNGALCAFRAADGQPWSEEDRDLLADAAGQIGVALEQVASHAALRSLSRTDALTGLLNRRAFFEEVRLRLGRQGERPRPGVLIYVDLDNFKLVNDRFGHQRGDAALKAVAEILSGSARAGDLVARLGGDEFALWLDGADAPGAAAKARLLLERAAALAEFSGDAERRLGFSIGIAPHAAGADEAIEALVARADAAMYAAKQRGKGGFALIGPDGGTAS